MCGILGQLNFSQPVNRENFSTMLATLVRRGPDGVGCKFLENGQVAFGHTRLAIIDLSDAGSQPMSNEDMTVWMVFNGEIYNFACLRRELEQSGHRFRSNTDSEAIIHAYEQWGLECVKRLRGIFAFGIYDSREKMLFLARDHIGVKPLYYHADNRSIIFASQPKAILPAEGICQSIDHSAFSLFMAYGNVPGEYSIYSGVKKLLPGHYLTLKDGKLNIRQYWYADYNPTIFNLHEAEEAVREKVEECVRLQSISDVPVGTLLSGGIDSTIITSILSGACMNRLTTFTVGFEEEESDERHHAAVVAEALHTDHHEFLLTYAESCLILPSIISAYDEPFHLNGLYPYYALSCLVKSSGFKVVMGGDGADELFVGYLWHERFLKELNRTARRADLGLLRRLFMKPAAEADMAVRTFFAYNGLVGPDSQRMLLGDELRDVDPGMLYEPLARHWRSDIPVIVSAQLLDFNCFLVDHCLTKVDRASMDCGVEVRVPFLDVELVDLIFSIDSNTTYHSETRKALLKKAMKSVLPNGMDTARKKGFSSPMGRWLEMGLCEAGRSLVLNGSLCRNGLLRETYLHNTYQNMNPANKLMLIGAELWYRCWFDNDKASVESFAEQACFGMKCGSS